MRTVGVFVDTCIVNRLLDIKDPTEHDRTWEEHRLYLHKLEEEFVKPGIIQLFVNPTVKTEIEKTTDPVRRQDLLEKFEELHFTPLGAAVFPITFPVTLLTGDQKEELDDLFPHLPEKDRKIFADAVCSTEVEILLTTDTDHLANDKLRRRLKEKGIDKKIMVVTPKELCEYLQRFE
jgi:predicted nucleic acid-binding protein